MRFGKLPHSAAWRHQGAREGFEAVFLRTGQEELQFEGGSAAIEEHNAWVVTYTIVVGASWLTHGASVSARAAFGSHELTLEVDGKARWLVNGVHAPHLDGCVDVDLESSALTNAFPVHRLGLGVGQAADAPAAYVRAANLTVERLEQRYVRLEDGRNGQRYHYAAPAFGFECQLVYDESGLVLEYPGIAIRAA